MLALPMTRARKQVGVQVSRRIILIRNTKLLAIDHYESNDVS